MNHRSMPFGIAVIGHEGAFRHFGRPHDVPDGVEYQSAPAGPESQSRERSVPRRTGWGTVTAPMGQTWWTSWTSRTMRSSAQGKGSSRSPSRTPGGGLPRPSEADHRLPSTLDPHDISWARSPAEAGAGGRDRDHLAEVQVEVRIDTGDPDEPFRALVARRLEAPVTQPAQSKGECRGPAVRLLGVQIRLASPGDHGEPGQGLGVFGRVRVHRIRERRAAHTGADGREPGVEQFRIAYRTGQQPRDQVYPLGLLYH